MLVGGFGCEMVGATYLFARIYRDRIEKVGNVYRGRYEWRNDVRVSKSFRLKGNRW